MPPPGYEPFLQTVLENPADDGARLVYADWLEEQGDPRGEFIRVQIESAKLNPGDPAFERLTDREMILLGRHGAEWRAEIPEWARGGCEFRRGFVSEVIIITRWQAGFGPELARMTPIEKVTLSIAHMAIEDFADGPELPHLQELAVLDDKMDPDDLKVLTQSPSLRQIRALLFMGMRLLDTGPHLIQLSPFVRRLQRLEMKRCRIGHRGVVMLAESENLPGLQWLDFSDNKDILDNVLGNAEFSILVNSPLMTHLTRLGWNDNGLTNDATRYLAQSTGADLLTHLEIANNHVGDIGARILMERFPHLELLDLSGNPLSPGMQYRLKEVYGERVHLGIPGE
jgi:uncharacterized protein (TIGR02996 family)